MSCLGMVVLSAPLLLSQSDVTAAAAPTQPLERVAAAAAATLGPGGAGEPPSAHEQQSQQREDDGQQPAKKLRKGTPTPMHTRAKANVESLPGVSVQDIRQLK